MTRRTAVLGLVLTSVAAAASPTLDQARAEADLEKKSKYALEFARQAVDPMVKAFGDAEAAEGRAWLAKIEEAVEISRAALEESDKNPRKKPKPFKHAEIETRKLARELENAKRGLIFEERELVDRTIAKVEDVNRDLLFGIMQRKKK